MAATLKPQPVDRSHNIVDAILPFVTRENEVLRSLALRAIAACGTDDPILRDVLLGALLDPDPDVRTDAMGLLAKVATWDDGPAILHSLEGDPVREVKLAAIHTLARLHHAASVPRLRALAVGRCDQEVAWEDDQSDWEDWLDIQVAAIEALGEMGVADSIDDMLIALQDEYGQALDVPVFNAWRQMGPPGTAQLVEHLGSPRLRHRKRAVQALLKSDADALIPYVETVLASDLPALRRAVIAALPPTDQRVGALAKSDPDPTVRRAAVHHAAHAQPGLAVHCLSDPSEAVQCAALDGLTASDLDSVGKDLSANLIAWMQSARAELASAAARWLSALTADHATEPLLVLAKDPGRPLEARVAAVEALAHTCLSADHKDYVALVANPSRQVRAAALRALLDLAKDGDEAAITLLARAIDGTCLPEDLDRRAENAIDGPEMAMPKGEGSGPTRIRISSDGEIIALDRTDETEATLAASTLESIQTANLHDPSEGMAEDTPEESAPKRRKRRAVEGPAAISDDLSAVAIAMAAEIDHVAIREAMQSRLNAAEEDLRTAAWSGLLTGDTPAVATPELITSARAALTDEVAAIRQAAFALLKGWGVIEISDVERALADEDGLLRAAALGAVEPESGVPFLFDPNSTVRQAAAERISNTGSASLLVYAVHKSIERDRPDALQALYRACPKTRTILSDVLSSKSITPRAALIVLRVLGEG